MTPGDIIFWRDQQFGHHRFWEVLAICLGGEQQEGLVRLVSLTHNAGYDDNGEKHLTTVVPEVLVRDIPLYSKGR